MRTATRRLAALSLAGLVVLAGCGGDGGDDEDADSTTTTEAAAGSTTESADAGSDTTEPSEDDTTTSEDGGSTDSTAPDPSDQGEEGTGAPDEEASDVSWDLDATEYRGEDGRRIAFLCPPDGTVDNSVWGTETYTDDSSVCVAAVHAGIINPVEGGRVVIEIAPGEKAYEGSEANGVTSQDYDSWDGSFTFPTG